MGPWMLPLEHVDYGAYDGSAGSMQINDNARIIRHVIADLKAEAAGDLWLCGKSQGACLSALMAAAGGGATEALAGAFVIAGSVLPPLERIAAPYEVPSKEKLRNLRLGFYSGKDDTHFTGVAPRQEGGTFERMHGALSPFFWNHTPKFWTKKGADHSSISPSKDGSEFKVLFAFVQNQEFNIEEDPDNERWCKA